MNNLRNDKHCFVFLQGPHGPFFAQLAKMLRHAGARCIRVGFNRGHQAFWSPISDYIAFWHDYSAWPETFERILTDNHLTDLVLYGDTRPIHAQAIEIAKARGIKIHVFEEGYLRPYWVTYERNGSNGHSRLMDITLQEMQDALKHSDLEVPLPPYTILAIVLSFLKKYSGGIGHIHVDKGAKPQIVGSQAIRSLSSPNMQHVRSDASHFNQPKPRRVAQTINLHRPD